MVMAWVPPLLLFLLVLIVVVPVGVYFGAVALLWASSLLSKDFAVSRTGFYCPFRKQRVTAEFLTETGTDRPSDVLSCSAFSQPYNVRCEKACRGLAETRSVSAALMPRFSLIAGGTAYRTATAPGRGDGDPRSDGDTGRAA
jgi:hypothetical protein